MINPSIKLRRLAAVNLTALAIAAMPSVATACPMCKEALASGGGDLVSGFFYSILFMLSMPFLIFGGISSYFYLLVRRARAQQRLAGNVSAINSARVEAEETVSV